MLETSYPACILDSDKIRLYRQANRVTSRAKYIGEQRVIKVMRSHSVQKRIGGSTFLSIDKSPDFLLRRSVEDLSK